MPFQISSQMWNSSVPGYEELLLWNSSYCSAVFSLGVRYQSLVLNMCTSDSLLSSVRRLRRSQRRGAQGRVNIGKERERDLVDA
jgi:hypothetical protein